MHLFGLREDLTERKMKLDLLCWLSKFENPNIKFGLSLQNGTTSTKEISTAKSEIVIPPQTHDLRF
ncbi:hypothetical protein DIC82_17565 [Clostridium beijerinckii]|nr:hypothetical protein DIC82_17565 [Clostridium beijerinckii]